VSSSAQAVAAKEPPPLTEQPPADRYCDLVLTGGVASGVVYPWAVVELARHYRFRNIAGTSVGAVAAALTAASEYGRRLSAPNPFEVLRRVPLELAEQQDDQRTKMLSLFQPRRAGRRLFELAVDAMTLLSKPRPDARPDAGQGRGSVSLGGARQWTGLAFKLLGVYARPGAADPNAILLAALLLEAAGVVVGLAAPAPYLAGVLLFASGVCLVLGWGWGIARAIRSDLLEAVVNHGFGFCGGVAEDKGGPEGFTEWMHKGIQLAAGLRESDPPLTFADLWDAPGVPGGPPRERGMSLPPMGERSINLEMMVSNVTFGGPLRFPLVDDDRMFYFREDEWQALFPASVMKALRAVAKPYTKRSPSDPDEVLPGYRRLPAAELPVVVAARMSMSFPLLFSAIPVYAVDYESPRHLGPLPMVENRRPLRRCWLVDGGLCSNFPIHLFDAAIPQWPTFGLWLARRLHKHIDPAKSSEPVWLPKYHLQGRVENWQRFEPSTQETEPPDASRPLTLGTLAGYLTAVGLTMKDWNDRTRMRQAHVRNRIARMALRDDEGQLHIAMPRETILRMAGQYGTVAGQALADGFVPELRAPGQPDAWSEHLYVRTLTLMHSLRELLDGIGSGIDGIGHSQRLAEVLNAAVTARPLAEDPQRPGEDTLGAALQQGQVDALLHCVQALRAIEPQLAAALDGIAYRLVPSAVLRVRPDL
jgi:predicted acylesterase/phospholipase RssA